MNLKVIVLPAKVLVDGTHRVRIAMSHRGTTRYFNTRFKVPSPKNVVEGQIVGVPNANYMNMRLLQKVTDIYKIYDDLEDADYYTCSQLLAIIEERIKGGEPKTFRDVVEEFVQNKKHGVSAGTMRIVSFAVKAFNEFFKADFFLKRLDSQTLYAFRDFMTKRGLNNSTQSIYFQILREVVNYAIKHKYVKYEVSPFMDFEEPKPLSRNVAVSIEELRTIRDKEFTGKSAAQISFVRDLFMCR